GTERTCRNSEAGVPQMRARRLLPQGTIAGVPPPADHAGLGGYHAITLAIGAPHTSGGGACQRIGQFNGLPELADRFAPAELEHEWRMWTMNNRMIRLGLLAMFVAVTAAVTAASSQALAQQQQRSPNILVIMGDDVGWFNIGAYHRGIMSGKTPNLDR